MGSEIKQPALGPIPLAGARESSVSPGAQRLLKGARTIDEKVQQTQKDLVSDPTLLKTVLSEKEIISGRNNLNLAAASWGKATERLVANWSGGKGLFEHIGSGGSRKTVDFVGLGRFEGLKFDITAAGYKNYQTKLGKYGQMVIVPQYTRPITCKARKSLDQPVCCRINAAKLTLLASNTHRPRLWDANSLPTWWTSRQR
jgi:hypothetical protein